MSLAASKKLPKSLLALPRYLCAAALSGLISMARVQSLMQAFGLDNFMKHWPRLTNGMADVALISMASVKIGMAFSHSPSLKTLIASLSIKLVKIIFAKFFVRVTHRLRITLISLYDTFHIKLDITLLGHWLILLRLLFGFSGSRSIFLGRFWCFFFVLFWFRLWRQRGTQGLQIISEESQFRCMQKSRLCLKYINKSL